MRKNTDNSSYTIVNKSEPWVASLAHARQYITPLASLCAPYQGGKYMLRHGNTKEEGKNLLHILLNPSYAQFFTVKSTGLPSKINQGTIITEVKTLFGETIIFDMLVQKDHKGNNPLITTLLKDETVSEELRLHLLKILFQGVSQENTDNLLSTTENLHTPIHISIMNKNPLVSTYLIQQISKKKLLEIAKISLSQKKTLLHLALKCSPDVFHDIFEKLETQELFELLHLETAEANTLLDVFILNKVITYKTQPYNFQKVFALILNFNRVKMLSALMEDLPETTLESMVNLYGLGNFVKLKNIRPPSPTVKYGLFTKIQKRETMYSIIMNAIPASAREAIENYTTPVSCNHP